MQDKTTPTESPTVKASLETFRTLSLPEKALTIAQTQAMLFSNTVVRTLSTLLRGASATPPKSGS